MSRGRLYSFQSAFIRLVIWTGTCGFGRRQADALAQLDAVEIQETFYRPVSVERAAKWRAQAPPPVPVFVEGAPIFTPQGASPPDPPSRRRLPPSREPAGRTL